MDQTTQHRLWIELARELLAQPRLRPEVARELEAAIQDRSERAPERIRRALARAMTSAKPGETERARQRERLDATRREATVRARHQLDLITHALDRMSSSGEVISQRLCAFLREGLLEYVEASAEAGAPDDLEVPEAVADRILERVGRHQVLSRPTRVGILSADEVAQLAAGRVKAAETPTVLATGNVETDLKTWLQQSEVDAERRRAVESGELGDGEYLYTVIEPTPSGRRIIAHPLTSDGIVAPQPIVDRAVERIEVEPISATRAVLGSELWTSAKTFPEPDRPLAPPGLDHLARLRDAAVALNQARIDLYAQVLEGRSDLRGAARRAAERRLERMQQESRSLAGELDAERIESMLGKWVRELSRDMGALSARALGRPGEIDALSRMGALGHRLDGVVASVRGVGPTARDMRQFGSESMSLARPQEDTTSIFQGLDDAPLASAAQPAVRHDVVGERLSTEVTLRDAHRSRPPSRRSRQLVQQIARGGSQLRAALGSISSLQQTGLGMSSSLRPLLRSAGMPTDIRPDMSSPLLRNLLLPAMEAVSGPGARPLASRGGDASLSPEAAYAAMLGEAGLELAERQPEAARNVLSQMGGLLERLSSSGITPTLNSLVAAGEALRERAMGLVATGEEAVPGEADAGDRAAEVVGEAAGHAVEAAPVSPADVGPSDGGVQDVAGALEQEGAALSQELRSRIEPFIDIASDQRVMTGPITDLALSKMGASGATVGKDIYLKSSLRGKQLAAVAAHELTHVQEAPRGGSLESQEESAYRVESEVAGYFEGRELAAEQIPDAGGSTSTPRKTEEKGEKAGALVQSLAREVERLIVRDLEFRRLWQ